MIVGHFNISINIRRIFYMLATPRNNAAIHGIYSTISILVGAYRMDFIFYGL